MAEDNLLKILSENYKLVKKVEEVKKNVEVKKETINTTNKQEYGDDVINLINISRNEIEDMKQSIIKRIISLWVAIGVVLIIASLSFFL